MILKVYHTHGMEEDTKALSTPKQVAIITHEDFIGNIMEIHLTQFFQDIGLFFEIITLPNNVRVYDQENEVYWGELTLMRKPYTKKMVNETEKLKSIFTDLMIILAHGKTRGNKTPSAVYFAPEDAKILPGNLLLWARDTFAHLDGTFTELPSECVTLVEVTAESNLGIVLYCRGDEILEDFKSMNPKDFTDMLVCNRSDMDIRSFCIFFVFLVNLVDSDPRVRPGPDTSPPKIHEVVKDNIRKKFQYVKQFGDTKESFWTFLQDRGFVSEVTCSLHLS